MQQVRLGDSGLRVSKLAIGTGTSGWSGSSNQTRLGFEQCVRLLRYAFEQGITFWDAADEYGSHPHVAAALRGLNRGEVVITSKTRARTFDTVVADTERFCREMQTDYVDIVLLHCLMEADWTTRFRGAMDALTQCRERGLVRAVGVSCHSFDAFQAAAGSPWVQIVLARINYAGTSMDASPEEVVPVIQRMHESGKGVYGMKVVGAGPLTHDMPHAIRYALELAEISHIKPD